MKSRDGKSQREEKSRRERVRRKKMQMRESERVGKSQNTVFCQWFDAPEGRKVGSLKRRVRSQLGRWEMKNCTPLWREAHFQVKMYKTRQVWTVFWTFPNTSLVFPQWTMTVEQRNNEQWQWNNGTVINGTMDSGKVCVCGGGNNGEKWNAFRVVSSY